MLKEEAQVSTQRSRVARSPFWVRFSTLLIGTVGLGVINWVFDYPFYGVVTERLTTWHGLTEGGLATFIVMSILSWVLSYLIIRYYDHTERDWLGLEALKFAREMEVLPGEKPSMLQRMVRMGDFPAFLILAIYDPVYSTIYLRRGRGLYNGFSSRDWMVFNLSVLYTNALWTSGWLATIEFIRFIPWIIERLFV